MIMLCSDTAPPPGDTRGMSQQSHLWSSDARHPMPVNSLSDITAPINPGLRDILLRRTVTTQRVARYWSLLHRSIVAELNMKLRLNSFFSKPCSTHERDCWKAVLCLVKTVSGRSLMAVTDPFVPIISWLIARTLSWQIIAVTLRTLSDVSPWGKHLITDTG